MHVTKNKNI